MSTIGSRIRSKRQEMGLSVDELATKLGKNRATVYRYESDDIENFPISVIGPLATALQTSPAYLMGWVPEEESAWSMRFRERLSAELKAADQGDIVAAGANIQHMLDIASGDCALSFPDACSIADTLGLSLDDMVGLDTAKSAPDEGSGLDMDIINLLLSLPEGRKIEAVNYIRYLAGSEGK